LKSDPTVIFSDEAEANRDAYEATMLRHTITFKGGKIVMTPRKLVDGKIVADPPLDGHQCDKAAGGLPGARRRLLSEG
jgi:hypothetical protein